MTQKTATISGSARVRHVVPTLPLLAGLLAAAALVGWAAGIVPLRQIVADRVAMQVATAVALLLASIGALCDLHGRSKATAAIGAVLVVLGGGTLLTYASQDPSFGPAPVDARGVVSGRMALQTALSVCGLGVAMLLSHRPSRAARQLREWSALLVAFGAYLSVIGHVLGAQRLWIIGTTHVAPNTAVALLALATTVLLAGPHGVVIAELLRPEEGGWVARRLLPITLVLPLIIGWLRLAGEIGGHFDTADGVALLVVTSTVFFATATWWVASVANRVASERARVRAQLQETELEREVRRRFVSSLAHDLRAPLASIHAGAERLSRGPPDPTSERVAQVVLRGADRLDRMIRDLLDVERARSGGQIAIARAPGDASAIIDEIVHAQALVHGDRLVAVVERPMEGCWDRDALERILENLVGNAFKYGAEDGRVRVTARLVDDRLCLSVHNMGNPLRPSEIPRLLEPFRRGSDTRGRTGWGIGLPVVRGLSDALGGRLEVESSTDEGTTFRVWLPRG